MINHIRANLILIAGTLLICSVGYPALLLLLGQAMFPASATGSLLQDDQGNTVGSRLIAQEFKGDEWFQPRPSAVDYNAAGSGGSNLGANNPKLRERVETQIKSMKPSGVIAADAVTTSGSGLDPHISRSNALQQLDRVTRLWTTRTGQPSHAVRQRLESLLTRLTFEPMWGLTGSEPLINVLEMNLALRQALTSQP